MAEFNYNLKEPNSDNETLIYLIITFSGKRIKFSTGYKVTPSEWNSRKQEIRETRQNIFARDINDNLDKIMEEAKRIMVDLQDSGKLITSDLFRNSLRVALGRQESVENMTFGKYVADSL